MKTTPILFNGAMVKAILEGRKTRTRRVVKPQPHGAFWIIRLTDERLYGKLYANTTERSVEYEPCRDHGERVWRCIDGDSFFPECGLPGWIGRTSVLPNEVLRLWEEGARGLVSVERARRTEGVSGCEHVSQQQENDASRTPPDMRSVSRGTKEGVHADSPHGRKPKEQCSSQSFLGYSGRELERPQVARTGDERGKAPYVKADECGERAYQVVRDEGNSQPETYSASSWNEPGCDIRSLPWQVGQKAWVRETWSMDAGGTDDVDWHIGYRADLSVGPAKASDSVCLRLYDAQRSDWRPSIHMPRWASRITLEVTGVRVERVQEITREDAKSEGAEETAEGSLIGPRYGFMILWDSINAKRGYGWSVNPWVWVIEFKRVER